MLHVDCHGWLSDNLLERGDRMSMAASLELRPPFLSTSVVDLAFRLPTRVKLRGREGKWIVKQVGLRYLPEEIVGRRKVGFRVPLDRWFRGELQDMARDKLCSSSSFVANALDRRFVVELLDKHAAGRSNEAARIWTLLCLEVWHETLGDQHPAIRQESA
jgi:asparagine synthase (glutamine-hydrolysing)